MTGVFPGRPSLAHLKKQAKQLLAGHRRGESAATDRFIANLPGFSGAGVALHDAQSVIAREHGFAAWARLRDEVRLRVRMPHGEPDRVILVEQPDGRVRPADRHINRITFAPGRETLLSAGMDGRIREWDPATGAELRALQAHPKSANTLSFHPDETFITSGSSDGTARVRAWPSLEEVAALRARRGASSVFSPLGDRIYTVALDGKAHLWTWPGLEAVGTIRVHPKRAVAHAFTPDGEGVLTSGLEGILAVTSLSDGTTRTLRETPDAPIVSLAFVPGADRIVAMEHGRSLRLLSWPDLETHAESTPGAAGIYTLAFHPSEEVFAICVERGVQIRRNEDLALLGTLPIPAKGVYTVAFSPDDRWLAAAGADQRIRIWRMTDDD